MAVPAVEIIKHLQEANDGTGLKIFDDLKSHRETLKRVTERAAAIIMAAEKGALTKKDRQELPVLLADLEALLNAQLNFGGALAQIDRSDGSYDNRTMDEQLRILIREIRNYNININSYFGTRTVKKIAGWLHDLPKWFTIRYRTAKDYIKHAAIPVAIAGAGVVAGYSWWHGGISAGLGALGSHAGTAGSYIAGGWNRLRGLFA